MSNYLLACNCGSPTVVRSVDGCAIANNHIIYYNIIWVMITFIYKLLIILIQEFNCSEKEIIINMSHQYIKRMIYNKHQTHFKPPVMFFSPSALLPCPSFVGPADKRNIPWGHGRATGRGQTHWRHHFGQGKWCWHAMNRCFTPSACGVCINI